MLFQASQLSFMPNRWQMSEPVKTTEKTAPQAATTVVASSPTPTGPSRSDLLIVGQNPLFIDSAKQFSEAQKLNMHHTKNGIEAWHLFALHRIGIILASSTESGLSLLQLLSVLNHDDSGVRVPVLMKFKEMTDQERELASELGYSDWVKDVSQAKDLLPLIENTFENTNIVTLVLTWNMATEKKLKNLFQATNVVLKFTYNSKDFIRKLELTEPDLVIVDLDFDRKEPVFPLLQVLTTDSMWSKIPKCTLSAPQHSLLPSAQKMDIKAHISDALTKPDLYSMIQKMLPKPMLVSGIRLDAPKEAAAAVIPTAAPAKTEKNEKNEKKPPKKAA